MLGLIKRARRLLKPSTGSNIPENPLFSSYRETEAGSYLQKLMRENYTVENLKNVDSGEFESHISDLPGKKDATLEGYRDSTQQRDLSVQFDWGHNHNFGSFYMQGQMGYRHIDILAAFMSLYGKPERDLTGKSVLDIGCWTGGTSLLLAAMGANVYAIEEVKKYSDCVRYLKSAFGIDNLEVENVSLYSLDNSEFYDRFDLVLYSPMC